MTPGDSGETICRDYRAALLFHTAERMDATDFTDNVVFCLLGGYPLFFRDSYLL